MQFLDFSPPAIPSLDQQRDALRKGLGRAMQWAAAGVLAFEPLLEACRHDQRFDRQCEDERGEWLWKIIHISGHIQRLRDPLLDAFRELDTERHAQQLCELALRFAQNGDDAFRHQLYEFVRQRPIPDSPVDGEEQLLRLDGGEALTFIARLRGQHLATHDWEWHDDAVIDRAIRELGEPRVRELLTGSLEPEIRRFAEGWLKNANPPKKPEPSWQSHVRKMQAITLTDVLHAVDTEDNCSWFRGWGMHADEPALEAVLERLRAETTPAVIVKLLRVFSNRPLPKCDPRLIDLAKHDDRDVRHWALKALQHNSHPMIRAFALNELLERTQDGPVVALLIKNFEAGDEQRLLDHLELPEDTVDERHWMLMDMIKLLQQNESADRSKLGQIAYFNTPCQICRFDAVRLLSTQGCAPEWLAEECSFDAEDRFRAS